MNQKNTVKSVLGLLAFLFVILGLMIGLDLLLKPIYKKNDEKDTYSKYSKAVGGASITKLEDIKQDSDNKAIINKFKAFEDDKEIATLYEVTLSNDYGKITILTGVDQAGLIIGVEAIVDQSIKKDDIKAYFEGFKGSNIADFKNIDGVSKPTVAVSIGTGEEVFRIIADSHGIVSDPYADIFGKDYKFGSTLEINNGMIKLQKEVIVNDEVVALVYFLEGKSLYNTHPEYGSDEEKSIELQLIVEPFTTRVINYVIDLEKYNHTKGWKEHVDNYLNMLVNNGILAGAFDEGIEIDETSGATSGKNPSNTVKLVINMLKELKEYLNFEVSAINEITDNVVKKHQTMKINDEVYDVYYLTKEGKYDTSYGDASGEIELVVFLDKDGKISAINYPLNNYHHTKREVYLKNLDNYIKNVVVKGVNINEIDTLEIDETSGATSGKNPSNTVKLAISMLGDLKTYKGAN